MTGKHAVIVIGTLAALGVLIVYLDGRQTPAGSATVSQAGAVAAFTPLGWWSPLLPLQLSRTIAESAKFDTLKV